MTKTKKIAVVLKEDSTNDSKQLTWDKLLELQTAIRTTLLPIKGTGLALELTLLVSSIDDYIAKKKKDLTHLNETFAVKNEDGSLKYFAVEGSNFKLDATSNFIEVSEEDSKKIPSASRADTACDDYREAYTELFTTVDIVLKPLNRNKINIAFDKALFDGLDLTPFIGYIIDLQ